MTSRAAVVTVSYNSAESVELFLDSLESASETTTAVVIADNASDDVDALRSVAAAHRASVIELPENVGYGSGVMAAFDSLENHPPYVIVANPDVTFSPGAIDELLRVADEHPEGGSFGPRILEPNGEVYPSARPMPTLATGIGHALFSRAYPSNPWTRRYRPPILDPVQPTAVGWLSGSFLLVRTAAFEAIGGFDRSYFMYFEDVDLGARLSDAGWLNLFVPNVTVTHEGGHSTKRTANAMVKVHHQSAYRFLARRYPGWYFLPVRVGLRVGLGVRSWWMTRPRRS